MEEVVCWDCKKKLESDEEVILYDTAEGSFCKCVECHGKDSVLRGYQPCDVYSRVVGYYSPTRQWNVGKKSEYKDRKEFSLENKNKN